MNSVIDYDDFDDALVRADSSTGASEAHGIVCGLLCARGAVAEGSWAEEVIGHVPEKGDALAGEAVDVVARVKSETLRQLNDTDLGFDLLLPSDEHALHERLLALREWCQGFLSGFSTAEMSDDATLPEQVNELLGDFIEITKVEVDTDEQEDDEESFMQVVEYVRVGVLLIYEELHPVSDAPGLQ